MSQHRVDGVMLSVETIMIELKADLFSIKADIYCVTTNGEIRSDGKAVMGAGVAKYVRDKFEGIDTILAHQLRNNGNIVNTIWGNPHIVSFPTKNKWRDKSCLVLIEDSLKSLSLLDGVIVIPRPGCSNGGLDWETCVKPLCEKYLVDDRFIIVNT